MKNKDKQNVNEKLLIGSGFKKKWFSDQSGYWFEKTLDLSFPISKGVKLKALAEPDTGRYYIDIYNKTDGVILYETKRIDLFLSWPYL